MEYVYAAMLLHSAKKEVNESAVSSVLKAAGVEADASRVKALIASLKDISIDEAIEKAAVSAVAAAPVASSAAPAEDKKEEKKEEEEGKSEEEAAQGLGSLFG
jgi:large subunit ribosomal protein L12